MGRMNTDSGDILLRMMPCGNDAVAQWIAPLGKSAQRFPKNMMRGCLQMQSFLGSSSACITVHLRLNILNLTGYAETPEFQSLIKLS
jgi:hypothetical protein